jgi:hypothetical protein
LQELRWEKTTGWCLEHHFFSSLNWIRPSFNAEEIDWHRFNAWDEQTGRRSMGKSVGSSVALLMKKRYT